MTAKKKKPQVHANSKEIARVIALRELGYSTNSISAETGLSTAQVSEHIRKHGAKKGSATEELIEQTRKELISKLTDNNGVLNELVTDLHDDITRHRHMKRIADTIIINALSDDPEKVATANVQAKAFASITTGLKNLKDIHTKSINNPRLVDLTQSDQTLEDYVITVISDEDARKMQREKQGNLLAENEELFDKAGEDDINDDDLDV